MSKHGETCNGCGAELGAADRYCGECGLLVAPVEPIAEPGEVPPPLESTGYIDDAFPTQGRAVGSTWKDVASATGTIIDVGVRLLYVAAAGAVAVLGFSMGSPIIGIVAALYGVYILFGGRWFIA